MPDSFWHSHSQPHGCCTDLELVGIMILQKLGRSVKTLWVKSNCFGFVTQTSQKKWYNSNYGTQTSQKEWYNSNYESKNCTRLNLSTTVQRGKLPKRRVMVAWYKYSEVMHEDLSFIICGLASTEPIKHHQIRTSCAMLCNEWYSLQYDYNNFTASSCML